MNADSGSTKARYPLIAKLFELISSDNGGCTADEIEESLRGLSDADLDTLAAGEYTDQEAVKARLRERFDAHVVDSLDALLEVAFQGCYALENQPPEPAPATKEQCFAAANEAHDRWNVGRAGSTDERANTWRSGYASALMDKRQPDEPSAQLLKQTVIGQAATISRLKAITIECAKQQPSEPEAVPAGDKWLSEEDFASLFTFYNPCNDMDADGYTVAKEDMQRLAEFGCVSDEGRGRYSTTRFGDWIIESSFLQKPKLPLQTIADFNASSAKQSETKNQKPDPDTCKHMWSVKGVEAIPPDQQCGHGCGYTWAQRCKDESAVECRWKDGCRLAGVCDKEGVCHGRLAENGLEKDRG